jgi:hypothetical protein
VNEGEVKGCRPKFQHWLQPGIALPCEVLRTIDQVPYFSKPMLPIVVTYLCFCLPSMLSVFIQSET